MLAIVAGNLDGSPGPILHAAKEVSVHLADYLEEVRFPVTWDGLRRTHRTPERLLRAFHGWFDGLRTMKLVHHLSAREFPRCGHAEALPELLRMAGVTPAADPEEQLALLRKMEGGVD